MIEKMLTTVILVLTALLSFDFSRFQVGRYCKFLCNHFQTSDKTFANMDEPIVATDYSMSIVRRKMRHYKIFLGVTFLAFLACLVLLIVSIAAGLGCYSSKVHILITRGPDSMKFLHVSDVHLDLYYNSTTSTKSFCRSIPNTLNITPVSAPFTAPYGRVGCDSPQALVQSSLNFMRKLLSDVDKKFDFILLTGKSH